MGKTLNDALEMAKKLGIEIHNIPIKTLHNQFQEQLHPIGHVAARAGHVVGEPLARADHHHDRGDRARRHHVPAALAADDGESVDQFIRHQVDAQVGLVAIVAAGPVGLPQPRGAALLRLRRRGSE